jgi:hypothetical protein
MTTAEKKKAKILAVALVVAAIVWFFALTGGPPVPTATGSGQVPAPSPAAVAGRISGEGVIRVDLLPEALAGGDAGSTNLFQYRPRPASPAPPALPSLPAALPPAQPYQPPVSPPPQPPAVPPFRQFRYEAVVKGAATGRLTAYLTDVANLNSPAFEAAEGDVLLGQYKITRLTETMVEVEDLFQKRRQSFPKVQQ